MKPGLKDRLWVNVTVVNCGKRHGGHTPFIRMNGSGHAPSLLEHHGQLVPCFRH